MAFVLCLGDFNAPLGFDPARGQGLIALAALAYSLGLG